MSKLRKVGVGLAGLVCTEFAAGIRRIGDLTEGIPALAMRAAVTTESSGSRSLFTMIPECCPSRSESKVESALNAKIARLRTLELQAVPLIGDQPVKIGHLLTADEIGAPV